MYVEMLQTLPLEIILSICDYIEYKDILTLQQVNKQMYNICCYLEPKLITSQLKQINDTIKNMSEIINKNTLPIHFEKYINSKEQINYIKYFKLYNYYRLRKLSDEEIIKTITYNISYNVKLFKELAKNQYFKPLVIECFKYLIKCHKQKEINLTIVDFYNISTVCANGYILSILFGRGLLNLIKSVYIEDDNRSHTHYIKNIVRYKFLNKTDTFLSINYNMIKIFLQKNNMILLKYINREELNFIYNYDTKAQHDFMIDNGKETRKIIIRYTRDYFS